ncbi:MAG: hypothetical protein WBW31_09400 [Candidatus Sulfotelmatobacter sp.]
MTDKKPRLTIRKRMTLQRIAIATATNAADITRAEKELRRLEALPKGRPRGKSFQKKVAPESSERPSTPSSAELSPGPATADNSRRHREAIQAPNELPIEPVIPENDRKAADEARKLAGIDVLQQFIRVAKEEPSLHTHIVLEDEDGGQFPLSPGALNAVLRGWR